MTKENWKKVDQKISFSEKKNSGKLRSTLCPDPQEGGQSIPRNLFSGFEAPNRPHPLHRPRSRQLSLCRRHRGRSFSRRKFRPEKANSILIGESRQRRIFNVTQSILAKYFCWKNEKRDFKIFWTNVVKDE